MKKTFRLRWKYSDYILNPDTNESRFVLCADSVQRILGHPAGCLPEEDLPVEVLLTVSDTWIKGGFTVFYSPASCDVTVKMGKMWDTYTDHYSIVPLTMEEHGYELPHTVKAGYADAGDLRLYAKLEEL